MCINMVQSCEQVMFVCPQERGYLYRILAPTLLCSARPTPGMFRPVQLVPQCRETPSIWLSVSGHLVFEWIAFLLPLFSCSASTGAKSGSSPAEIASNTTTIVTMLPASPHVRQVYTGDKRNTQVNICLTSLTRAKCGTRWTLCWKILNISDSTELFAL